LEKLAALAKDEASKTQRADLIHNLAKEVVQLHESSLTYPQAFRESPSADFDKFFSTISTQINKQREVRKRKFSLWRIFVDYPSSFLPRLLACLL
jgi:hypothetical protein